MRLIAPIDEASRLMPRRPDRADHAASIPEAAIVRPHAGRPTLERLSTIERETASAAVAAQMLGATRRGLKADPVERARFAKAYVWRAAPPPGQIVTREA